MTSLPHALARRAARNTISSCTRCDLPGSYAEAPVPFRGPSPCKVMVLGEAPGFEEDKTGKPFVGPSGKWLAKECERVGVPLEEFFIANTVSCYPGGRTPNKTEITACLPNLRLQIQLADPEWILALGAVATRVLGGGNITNCHGKPFEGLAGPGRGRRVFPTYHPAAALRQEKYARALVEDLEGFRRVVEGEVEWKDVAGVQGKRGVR